MTSIMTVFSGNRVANARNMGTCKRFLMAFCSLWLIAAVGTICVPKPLARAQSTADIFLKSRTIENGWWCPESRRTIPHLQISTGDQIHLSHSQLISARPEKTNYRAISLANDPIWNQPASALGLEVQRISPVSYLEAERLVPESFLFALQSKYAAWESRLEDSEPRLNVNGLLVYPLLQVNYAGWRLPIGLYIPPLRGSDARR